MLQPTHNGERFELLSPTAMPRAAGFLWNPSMMIQVTCRGYAVAQFMQPEPAKYAYAAQLKWLDQYLPAVTPPAAVPETVINFGTAWPRRKDEPWARPWVVCRPLSVPERLLICRS